MHLTRRQKEILDFVAAHIGTQPDMRAMAAKVPSPPGWFPAAAKWRASRPSWMLADSSAWPV